MDNDPVNFLKTAFIVLYACAALALLYLTYDGRGRRSPLSAAFSVLLVMPVSYWMWDTYTALQTVAATVGMCILLFLVCQKVMGGAK